MKSPLYIHVAMDAWDSVCAERTRLESALRDVTAERERLACSLAIRNAECAAWRNARNHSSVVENWGSIPAIQERIEKDCKRIWNTRVATDADGGVET